MELKPKYGVDKLLFGMARQDVVALYGNPDKEFKDEDKNIIYVYNGLKLRLTFYEDENFRLGYIITSNENLTLLDNRLIGEDVSKVKAILKDKGFKSWETERFDISTNHFNEENWVILEEEFDQIMKVEIGAIINENDEFDWKFK